MRLPRAERCARRHDATARLQRQHLRVAGGGAAAARGDRHRLVRSRDRWRGAHPEPAGFSPTAERPRGARAQPRSARRAGAAPRRRARSSAIRATAHMERVPPHVWARAAGTGGAYPLWADGAARGGAGRARPRGAAMGGAAPRTRPLLAPHALECLCVTRPRPPPLTALATALATVLSPARAQTCRTTTAGCSRRSSR